MTSRRFPAMQSFLEMGGAMLAVAALMIAGNFAAGAQAADGAKTKAQTSKSSDEDDLQQLANELDAAEAEENETTETRSKPAAATEQGGAAERITRSRRNQAAEQRDRLTQDPKWRPTHEQIARFEIGARLNNFCLDSQGRILACCGDQKIRVLSQDGKLLETWELPFAPEAIGLCQANGTIFVGGEGHVAKLGPDGSVLEQKEFPPPMTDEQIEQMVQEQVKAQQKMFEDYIRGLKAQLASVEKQMAEKGKKAGERAAAKEKPSEDEKTAENRQEQLSPDLFRYVTGIQSSDEGFSMTFKEDAPLEAQAEVLRWYAKMIEEQYGGPEKLADQLRQRMKMSSRTATYTGIAAAPKDLFVVCSAPGFSYNAWRLNHQLDDPKLIVKGLRGCCGQMDCQTHDGDLWIPLNTEHKVYRYDRDGNVVSKFGQFERERADAFGGCCEPKNIRFADDGFVYCAESGPPVCVKRFTLDGQFQDVVCFPVYKTGCVRVSVDKAGEKVFLMSPNEQAIYVFAPPKAEPVQEKRGQQEQEG